MFWPFLANHSAVDAHCLDTLGVRPRREWIGVEFGGLASSASNIVFSNGDYDPWSSGGVRSNLSDTVVAVLVEGGAHHLDLFFSNDLDPASVKAARRIELEHVARWISEKRSDAA